MSKTHHSRMLGDTYKPLNSIIYYGNDPLGLAALTVKFRMEADAGTSVVAESTTGVTIHPTQSFTANGTTALATCVAHGVKEGDQIVVSNSGGSLPSGLSSSARYFAVQVTPNAFGLASLPQGTSVITGAGSGTNSFYIVGSVQKVFLSADVGTVGRYRSWWTVYSGSDGSSAPVSEQGITVEILPFGN